MHPSRAVSQSFNHLLHRQSLTGTSEIQSELPLWSTGLESLGYADPFPKYPKGESHSPIDHMEDINEERYKPQPELSDTDEEKGWRFFIAAICNRRTVNAMLEDMWRSGEKAWVANVHGIVERTNEAEKVLSSWCVSLTLDEYGLCHRTALTHENTGTKCRATDSRHHHRSTKTSNSS